MLLCFLYYVDGKRAGLVYRAGSVGGNKYRLICRICYATQKVFGLRGEGRKWTRARPSYTLTRERAATAATSPPTRAFDGESMMGGLTPDEDLVRRLPLPLAQLYRRAHNAKTPLDRHNAAYCLWEAA